MKFPPLTSFTTPPRGEIAALMERLRDLGVFPDASDRELRTIAQHGTEVTIPKDWSLIHEQTPADKAYVVLSGSLSVRHGSDEVATIEAGELVGEMAIVAHQLRSATVVAATPLEVVHFTREAVEELREKVPAFRAATDTAVASRAA